MPRKIITAFDRSLQDPMAASRNFQASQREAAALAVLDAAKVVGNDVFKETTISQISPKNIYGRNSIFDACAAGDIFGLQVQTNSFLQWIGWRPNRFYRKRVDFIAWWGPSGTAAGTPVSFAGAPCDDPNGWEYGAAGYEMLHKSWYHIAGDPLDPHTLGLDNRCETSPRYRINGQMITDDVEWQMNGIMNVLQQNVRRDVIHGSHNNAYEMDGLENLIRTGITDDGGHATPMLDSILVNWASDDLDGTANGFGNFFEYLDEVVTEIEWRSTALGTILETDMILMVPRFMATALLDAYACYTTCGVTSTNDITDQALRAQQRAERRALNGGPLFDGNTAVGYIHLKSGRRLPILVEDTIDISRNGASYCGDIYLLTRRIGATDVLQGEYLDLRRYENAVKRADPNFRVRTDAAGRFAIKGKEDNWCWVVQLGTSPELYLSAPWAQARISNVCVARSRQPLVGDPYQPLYLPGGGDLYVAWGRE